MKSFIASLPHPDRCVVKPSESAGTDSVFILQGHADSDISAHQHLLELAVESFGQINQKENALGRVNDGVLVQVWQNVPSIVF